jgi:hypothetical protein
MCCQCLPRPLRPLASPTQCSSTQACRVSAPQVAPLQAVPAAVTLQQLQQQTQQAQQLQQLGLLGQQQLGTTIVAPGQMAQAAQLQQQYAWAAK